MKLQQKFNLYLFLVFLLLPLASAHSEQYKICNDYIAGFIKGKKEGKKDSVGLDGANVVIIDNRGKLASLKSTQNGWFENYSPLSKNTTADTINLIALKRGYEPRKIEIKRLSNPKDCKNETHILDIYLKPISDYYIEYEDTYYQTRVLYGYLYDEISGKPVKGGVITITDDTEEDVLPISSAVTRDSGYFSLYYQGKDEYNYTLEHPKYTNVTDRILLNSDKEYFEKSMFQERRYYSIGMGMHIQTTGIQADLESGGAFSLSMTWYPDGLLLLERDSHRYKAKPGINGIELSVGVIPFTVSKPGVDKIDAIYMAGLGVVLNTGDFYSVPIQLRSGISVSDTGKGAIYLGFNIPFYFF